MNPQPLPVFIGYDSAQERAYNVAAYSARRMSFRGASWVQPLKLSTLRARGFYTRPTVSDRGRLRDIISDAPMSTEFALSRFLVPLLVQSGPAIFVDSDVLFLDDPRLMLDSCNWRDHAVCVVQHDQPEGRGTKMDGRVQTSYARKNWSSVMVFNCDHPAWSSFNLDAFNAARGLPLHQFAFLLDQEVGALHRRWNWLVGIDPMPEEVGLAHYTLGGPWLEQRANNDIVPEADALWRLAEEEASRAA